MSDTAQDTAVSDDVADTASDDQVEDNTADTATDDVAALRAELEQARRDAEKHKSLSRKHEDRAKANAEAAMKAKTVEERLAAAEQRIAEQEAAHAERSGRLALSSAETKLVAAGFNPGALNGLLKRIPPASLLDSDGEPDDRAIGELVQSLVKVAGRVTPDRDQGAKGVDGPPDMNSLIRQAVTARRF